MSKIMISHETYSYGRFIFNLLILNDGPVEERQGSKVKNNW